MRNLIEENDFTPVVSVPENGDPVVAELRDPAFQALTNRTRFLRDRIAGLEDRVVADEWVYPARKQRTITVPASRFKPNTFTSSNRYEFDPSPLGGSGVRLRLGSDSFATADLSGLIPTSANQVRFALIITAGGHLTEGRFYQVIKSISPTPSIGPTFVDLLGSVTAIGLQLVEHPFIVRHGWSNSGTTGELVYSAGTLDVGSYDYIEGAIITFYDPGPRNF